uniref:Metal-dependent hydrolase n=1 Tax=Fervidicoccus fontis TaxID=683846 RepID=A0A7J3ZLB3_9CREN
MKRGTHIIFGVGATLSLFNPPADLVPLVLVPALIASVLPDLDLRFKHRSALHNLFAMSLLTVLFYKTISSSLLSSLVVESTIKVATLAFPFAYSTHLILDSFTKQGVALLWPLSQRRFGLSATRHDDPILNAILSLTGIMLLTLWLSKFL